MFHVNIVTGSRIMTISFYGGLTTNAELRNSPSEFYPISGDWGELRITKFDTNLSNKMLLNAAKCQGYNFYYFISYQGKTKRGKGKITPLQFAKNLPKDALIFGQLIECNMRNT